MLLLIMNNKRCSWNFQFHCAKQAIYENDSLHTIIFNYYVNATNWPYWSATAVNVDPLTASAADVHAEILSGTDLTTAYLYQNESSTFAPGWYSNALINGANDDLEDAIPQGYFVIGITDRDGIDTYFLDIDGWNEANPPSIEIHWSAPGGRQGVYHAPVITEIPYNDDEIMDYKNAISEGLPIPVGLEGIRNYETIRFPNSSPREIIEGCGDFESYEIYTSDGMEVASVDTNYYIHENLINGTEYCYTVTQNMEDGSTSGPSNEACATPAESAGGESCDNPIALIADGIYEHNDTSSVWYSFTSGLDGFVTLSSDTNSQGDTWDIDTRVAVFSACEGAGWTGGWNTVPDGDNVLAYDDDGGESGTSTTTFECVSGDTYYILWDNYWGPDPFSWYLETEELQDVYPSHQRLLQCDGQPPTISV